MDYYYCQGVTRCQVLSLALKAAIFRAFCSVFSIAREMIKAAYCVYCKLLTIEAYEQIAGS
jgi:hypothetical protein